MGRKLPATPRSRVRSALRQLWLRSRERAAALKAAQYTCACGKKQSKAKGREIAVTVHHKDGVGNWEEVINAVYRELLCDPSHLDVKCLDCHERIHHA